MHPTLADHLLAAALVVFFPIYATRAQERFHLEVAKRGSPARLRKYAVTMAIEWGLVALTLALWRLSQRPLGGLGLQVPAGTRTFVGAGITALGLGFFWVQWQAILRLDDAAKARLRSAFGGAADLLPRTEAESRRFFWLALTAGICEELLYRGFLIAYASCFMPIWIAAVATGVLFGVAHWYQGGKGIVKTGVVGITAGLIYAGTGSLLWPMILHAVVDLQGGAAGRIVLAGQEVTQPAA